MHYYPVKEKVKKRGLPDELRLRAEDEERRVLHPKAAFSSDHQRFEGAEDDHRLPYKRDVDRIVHSKAYARYSDKTQVVYLVENDHISQRGLHVQLVSNFARGIGQILNLNLDLIEAISLGHDVGHPPFGHEGEVYLSELAEENGVGKFSHSWQSCKLLREIEPLNLGMAVYDGFLSHDGGMRDTSYVPKFSKTWDNHVEELAAKKEDPDLNITPMTLEGCLVKICDTASYIGRDIEDAISLGILKRSQVPETILGTTNREMLNTIGRDIIENSHGKEAIVLSDELYQALLTLRKFNFENIYIHPQIKVESERIKKGYSVLFEALLEEHRQKGEQSLLWQSFGKNKTESYRKKTSPEEMVVDYISGMTDRYFIRKLQSFTIPGDIKL